MFSITVLHDERIVVVAEQRPDSTEEDSFQWMSRVLQVHKLYIHTLTFRASSVVPDDMFPSSAVLTNPLLKIGPSGKEP